MISSILLDVQLFGGRKSRAVVASGRSSQVAAARCVALVALVALTGGRLPRLTDQTEVTDELAAQALVAGMHLLSLVKDRSVERLAIVR